MPDLSDPAICDPMAAAVHTLLDTAGPNALLHAEAIGEDGSIVGAVIVVRGPLAPEILLAVKMIEDEFSGTKTGRYYDEHGESVSIGDLERAADG